MLESRGLCSGAGKRLSRVRFVVLGERAVDLSQGECGYERGDFSAQRVTRTSWYR